MSMSTEDAENILKLLNNGTTVVLVGKPGSGKSWMARKLSALATKKGLIDFTIWVYLNRKYNTKALCNSIGRQLSLFSTTKPLDDDDNMDIEEVKEEENLAEEKISDALKGKSYLLVLDDEGKTMKEREIKEMLPSPLKNSPKVLITSVNEDGGTIDPNRKTVKVGSLSEEESTQLLEQRAGSEAIKFPVVKGLAEDFVKTVMDQPAAIIVTAKALSYFCESYSGVQIVESALKEAINGEKPNSIQLLSNAHDMLPNSILMDCAWSGSHFFRDRGSVHCNELIAYWIIEGFLAHVDSVEKAYEEGHRVLMDLIDCQFLKKVEGNFVVMERSVEADYIVQERAMLRLDDCHRSGFDGITNLGLAVLFEDGWKGLGRITQADGMIRTPKKGQERPMAMLDGNAMCKEVLNNFCLSNPQLQVLAIFNPTLKSLPPAFNPTLVSQLPVLNPTATPQPAVFPCMAELDILVLRGCDFLVDIGHIRELSKLTVLEISGARSLVEIPDDLFTKMTQLQSLHLSSLQITKLPESFYQLTEIHRLLLKDCPSLGELRRLAKCDNLVVIDLSGAVSLGEFPYKSLGPMQKLRTFNLSKTNIKSFPKFGTTEQVTHVSFRDCPRADRLPSIASLTRLQVLDISGSPEFIEIQDDSFGTNAALDILDLSGTTIRKLPSNIGNPRRLYLKGCSYLENLPFMESLKKLEELDLSGASNLKIEEKFFEFLGNLRVLNLSGTNITSLPHLSKHSELRQLLLSHCSSLQKLPQMKNLKKLEVVDLSGCRNLRDIQAESFHQMTSLQRLILSETQIEELPTLSELINLRVLCLNKCSKLGALPSLESLSKLEELNLCGVTCLVEPCENLFNNKDHLRILDLSETNLKKLPSISKLKNLSHLFLRGCKHFEEVPDFKELTKLEVLDLSGTAISQFPSLDNFANFHQLLLRDCPNLREFLHHKIPHMSGAIHKGGEEKEKKNGKGKETKEEEKGKGKEIEEEDEEKEEKVKNPYQRHTSNLPEMITNSYRPFISVSASTFFKQLDRNPLLGETAMKQFHLSVRSVDKINSGGIHCEGDIRGIYFQARHFSCFNKEGSSLEVYGYNDLPEDIENVLSCAEYVFLFDNAFVVNLYDLGAKNVKLMKGCWVERCENMVSVFHAKEVGDIELEMLWLSNLRNLTNICDGNLQLDVFQNLKQMYLDCCPKILSVFSLLQQPENLEILEIKFCDNLEALFDPKSGQRELPKLHTLHLLGLPKLKSIGCKTPNLDTLTVGECSMLVNVFYPPHLPENLTIVQIRGCDHLDTVIENSKSVDYKLPKLQTLHMLGLPKLRSIGGGLPSLQDCKISYCPNYKHSV